LNQRNEHNKNNLNQSKEHHQDNLNQREEHHGYEMEYKERNLTDITVTRCVNGLCGLGMLYSILALALGANYHLRGLMDDPCLYLEQTSPISKIPWTSWIPWKSQYASSYASCFFSVTVFGFVCFSAYTRLQST